ncbi:MAG: DUF1810 domain-containing protein [Nitrospiraceae bacterium]|nr:DUF1810 domain-containing protein [Nitrospiraceae bacterium]
MNPDDPYDLTRFLSAQEGVYERALAELKAGEKRTHWMWYIFPQIDGLGSSPTAKRYSIKSEEEARQYLDHPVLGKRLRECTEAVVALRGGSASEIFGYPDDLKFKSSMTLFEKIAGPGSVFSSALERYCHGERDTVTLRLLANLLH